MNDSQTKAVAAMDKASKEVHKQLVGKPGKTAETQYGEAYQGLVVAGLAPQIKLKYRP